MQPGLPFDTSPSYPPPVFVRHPRARRYVVSVKEDGRVRVTLPRWGSMRQARAFAGRLDAWIDKQRQPLPKDRARRAPAPPDPPQRALRTRAQRELPPGLLRPPAAPG